MITRQEFHGLYKKLQENYNGMDSLSKMDRCYNYACDLPVQAIREIIEDIIDNERHSPLPKDFLKYALNWKKNFYLKNGYYYGHEGNGEEVEKLDCDWCLDTGITKIKHHNEDSFENLMRCSCKKGEDSQDKIPQWSNDLMSAFKRVHLKQEWFNPNITESQTVKHQISLIMKKVYEWNKVKDKAVEYWSALGYK